MTKHGKIVKKQKIKKKTKNQKKMKKETKCSWPTKLQLYLHRFFQKKNLCFFFSFLLFSIVLLFVILFLLSFFIILFWKICFFWKKNSSFKLFPFFVHFSKSHKNTWQFLKNSFGEKLQFVNPKKETFWSNGRRHGGGGRRKGKGEGRSPPGR